MSLKDKSAEIQRLVDMFETEAAKFHDIQFHTYDGIVKSQTAKSI